MSLFDNIVLQRERITTCFIFATCINPLRWQLVARTITSAFFPPFELVWYDGSLDKNDWKVINSLFLFCPGYTRIYLKLRKSASFQRKREDDFNPTFDIWPCLRVESAENGDGSVSQANRTPSFTITPTGLIRKILVLSCSSRGCRGDFSWHTHTHTHTHTYTHTCRHRAQSNTRAFPVKFTSSNWVNLGPEYFFAAVVTQKVASPRRQTIVQIPPYFMITHVQTALRKAGNYDKTGRARKKHTERARLFVYTTTADRCSRQVGGGGTRAGHGVARASPLLGYPLARWLENLGLASCSTNSGILRISMFEKFEDNLSGFLSCF